MKQLKYLFLFVGMTLLTSCSSLLGPVQTTPPNVYLLNPNFPTVHQAKTSATNLTLLVAKPTSALWINNNHMVYQQKPNELRDFSKNQWADTPSNMIQPLLVQALQRTRYFHAVVAAPFSANYDEQLDVHLLDFYQDFTHVPSQYRIKAQIVVINSSTNHVIATTQYSISVPARFDTPKGGVDAANIAVTQLLAAIAKFIMVVSH